MFRSFRIFNATLLLLVSTPLLVLVAQDQPPSPQPKPTLIGPPKTAPSTQQTFVSYWTLEPGWNTELEMRNNMAQGKLTITPVLRTATGQEIPLIPVSLSPEQVISLNLQDAVGQVDPGIANHMGSFGSVVFRFAGHSAANMFAASVVRREGHPIDFHFDGEDSGPDSYSGGIEGIWWLPADTSTGYLMLSNPSNKAVKAKLVLSQSSGGTHQFPIVVGPGQTERMSIRDLLGPSSSGGMGGVRVSFPHAGALSATQIVFDEVTGLAAIMRMFDREPDDKVSSHVLRAPMMALTQPDPALAFPKGTVLIPRILLWNAGSSPLPMSATVDWRKEKASGTFQLPALKLLPEQARIIDLSELQRNTQIPASAMWSTITLNYTGRTADLVAVAIAYDKSSRYGLQTPFSEGTSRLFKGSMWHVDGTHNTLITTGNGGSEPTTAQVTLFYNDGQGKYRIEKPLSPGQQLWLDVGELIRNQVPDSDGHTMPPDTMTGSYELRDMDHPLVGLLYEGKLVIDKTFGHASYGCGRCCGYGPPAFVTNPFTGPPSNDYFDNVQAYDHCGNFMDDVTNAGYTWASSNTPVATLSSPTLHTVAVGTATGSTHFYLDSNTAKNCVPTYTTPQQPVYVGAYQVEPIATASQGPVAAGNCPTNQYPGYVRYVTNQVQYQTGAAYALSGLSVADTLTTGSRHDLGSGASTGTATTTGDGSFTDQYSVCSSACPGSTGETDATQNWTVNGVPLPHANGIVYKCTSITIDGR